jgi:hypothetical protein
MSADKKYDVDYYCFRMLKLTWRMMERMVPWLLLLLLMMTERRRKKIGRIETEMC